MNERSDRRIGEPSRHVLTRRELIKAGGAAGVLLGVHCTGATAPATARISPGAVNPGTVTVLMGTLGIERFDLAFTSEGADYLRLVHGWLVEAEFKDGRLVTVPGIASAWRVSADGKTWTFTIRKGVKFHDGTEVTAADVLWSLQHVIGPETAKYTTNAFCAAASAMTDRIEQTGSDQVSITTKAPVPDFALQVSQLGQNVLGAIYPKRASVHDVKEEEAYDRNPIGCGVMKLVSRTPGASMTFERFADYYYQPNNGFPSDKRVNFTRLELRLVKEEATRVAALQAGQADIAPISLATRKQVEAGGGRLVFVPEGAYAQLLGMGFWKPQFPATDKRVREALDYAINKEALRDRLYGADVMTIRGWCWVTPSTIGYSKDLDPSPFDPVLARQRLADAGYPGGKGVGQLVINTWEDRAFPLLPEMAQVIADSWKKELGLDVLVKVGDPTTIKSDSQVTEKYYGQFNLEPNNTRINAISITRSGYEQPTRLKRRHDDPELFALVAKTTAILDSVEQEKALTSLYKVLRDLRYDISLGHLNLPWGVGPRIRAWQPYPVTDYVSALHTIALR